MQRLERKRPIDHPLHVCGVSDERAKGKEAQVENQNT